MAIADGMDVIEVSAKEGSRAIAVSGGVSLTYRWAYLVLPSSVGRNPTVDPSHFRPLTSSMYFYLIQKRVKPIWNDHL